MGENGKYVVITLRYFTLRPLRADIISNDITRPWFENGAIINEVNYSPLITDQSQRNIILHLLHEWLPNNGRIPIEIFVGDGAAMSQAKTAQKNYTKNNIN